MATEPKSDFLVISTRLLTILRKYAHGNLSIRTDKPGHYELTGPPTPRSRGKEMWLGAVRIGKRYMSYHIMTVYAFPDLLDGISPELKKHMQGKSCFNFTHMDEKLFHELDKLTELGFERFKKEGFTG